MPLNLPNNPTIGQTVTEGSRAWFWNGRYWQATSLTVGYTGSQGATGTSIRIVGSLADQSLLLDPYSGDIGDGYLVEDTGHLWLWNGTAWNDIGKFTGDVGATGFTGSAGFTGSTGYTGSQGANGASVRLLGSVNTLQDLPQSPDVGDGYLVTDTGDLYIWNGSQYTNVGKITGETGPIGYTGSSGSGGVDEFRAASVESGLSTVEYAVTVAGPQGSDSGNKYMLNGAYKPTTNFVVGYIYVFNQDDATNVYFPNANGTTANPHPLNFSADNLSGELGGGTSYLTNVQYFLDDVAVTQTVYNSSSFETATARRVHITVTSTTPATLYYWCYNHTAMGNNILVAAPGSGSSGGSAGGSTGSTYISLVMTGTITTPFVGTSRFYPPKNLSITVVYASVTLATTAGAFTFVLKKNGVDIGATFSIAQGQNIMTPVSVNATLLTTDYLTLDVTGASATDLFVKIEYINT